MVHGWGANLSQELGIRTGTTVVRIPQEIEIQLEDSSDFVSEFRIRGGPSLIKTAKKKFFIAWEVK